MRVAAVQLNSTADPAANLAAADRLTRAAAADGASLIVLPEKWTAIGSDEQLRAAAETLEGPAIEWARAIAARAGGRSGGGVDPRARAGQGEARQHLGARGSPGRDQGRVSQAAHVRRGGRRALLSRVRARGARRGDRALADRRRRRAGAVDLLRPALPRAVPHPRRARRARDGAAGGVHAGDHPRSLGDARAGRARSRTRRS